MWFRKSSISKSDTAEELEKQKSVLKAASQKNAEVNQRLTATIHNNGFTVIIAAAMGAKHIEAGNNNGH